MDTSDSEKRHEAAGDEQPRADNDAMNALLEKETAAAMQADKEIQTRTKPSPREQPAGTTLEHASAAAQVGRTWERR